MIEFTQLDLTNILIFRETQSIPLAHQGLVHIDGINHDDKTVRGNGSGKSAIPEGLTWVLYGKTVRELRTVDSILHRWHKKDGEGCVRFKRGASNFEIKRYRAHSKYKNRIFVYQDGNDITVKDDVQAQINEILGMNYTTFVRTAVFTKRDLKSLSALKHADQNALFENVLGVDVFAKAQKRASKLIANITLAASETETQKVKYATRVDANKRLIKELRDAHDDFEKRRGARMEEVLQELKEVKAKSTNAEVGPGYSPKAFTKATDALNELKAKREDAGDEFEALAKARMKAYISRDPIKMQITTLEEELSGLFSLSVCPKCKRPLDEDHKKVTKKEVKSLKEQLAALDVAFAKADKAYTKARERMDALGDEIEKAEGVRTRLREDKTKYEEWKKHAEERASELKKAKDKLTKKLEEIAREEWYGQEKLDEARRVLDLTKNKLAVVEKKLEGFQRKKDDAEFWVKGFGRTGIPTDLINSVLPTLTSKVNDYLERLSRGAFKVDFDTQGKLASGETRDRFEVIVDNKFGAEEYGGNSVGELAKVDFAIALGFQALHTMNKAHAMNIAFYDEVFDGADGVAVDAIMELLTDIAGEKDSVFVMSHLDALKSSFPKTLIVEKKNKQSTVRWE